MKLLRNIGLIATLVVLFASCFEKDPEYVDFPSKDVDFIYAVAGDEYILDYYVVSEIQFTNTSAKTGNVTWDFGDGTTSNEANPIHKYAKAGTYQVKLTIDGVCSYPIMIYDIAPVLSVKSQSADVVTINDVTVDFNIFLPNPENLKVKYVWTFPEGTTNEAGDEMTEFIGYADENGNVEYPGKLKFRNIGSQRITLQTWFDTEGENRQLEDSYVNVQVGANHECKTLYYAALDGNIKALKLVDPAQLPEGTKNLPFDMGVKSGTMPFTLAFASIPNAEGVNEGWIYILDAGKQYTYINDENGVNGDGKITPEDRTMIGDPTPDVTYGLSLGVSYKNWDLSIEMMGQGGNQIYRTWDNYNFAQFNYMEQRLDRWHGEGTSNSQPLLNTKHAINRENSEYYVESGRFFRIRNLQLAYSFDKALISKIRLQALKMYFNVQNLKTWKHNTGYTPELGGSAIAFGVDNGSYPVPAIYTFGINLTF